MKISASRERSSHEVVRWGGIEDLSEIIENLGAKRAFVVAHTRVLRTTGGGAALEAALGGVDAVEFAQFGSSPILDEILLGVELYTAARPDVVLGVGGGTAIDVAKAIRAFGDTDEDAVSILANSCLIAEPAVPLIAVPTTSGTGSEATRFAVVYVGGRKHSIDHPYIRPEFAIVDAALTETLPPYVTACTGMDALAQGMESLWSVAASEDSIPYASQALAFALRHLETAVLSPTRESREGMALAAHLAGKAIDLTRTTAPHAASYPMTARFGLPHGHAVALTLPEMLVFNAGVTDEDVLDPRGVVAVQKRIGTILDLLGVSSAEDGRERLRALIRAIALDTDLTRLRIDPRVVVDEGFTPNRVANNPRRVTADVLAQMLSRTTTIGG